MAISETIADARVQNVLVTDDALTIVLRDGRKVSAPLDWFPRLKAASPAARASWTTSAAGHGVHWPEIDEDLSVEGLLSGQPAPRA
jgi:hypothetical protein